MGEYVMLQISLAISYKEIVSVFRISNTHFSDMN